MCTVTIQLNIPCFTIVRSLGSLCTFPFLIISSVQTYISLACTYGTADLILMHLGLSLRLLCPLSLEPLQLIGLVHLVTSTISRHLLLISKSSSALVPTHASKYSLLIILILTAGTPLVLLSVGKVIA